VPARIGPPIVDTVARAKLQIQLVVAAYRGELRRGNRNLMGGFRDRALSILAEVERRRGRDPHVARMLAEARRELGESAPR
jgi:hypothetical protein